MAREWLPDELWEEIESLLPKQKEKPFGGRPRLSDRDCLLGIIFVLRTGCAWNALPSELGCGSGVTCWRRMREWEDAGVFKKVLRRLLSMMRREGLVDLERAVVDSAAVRAVLGGRTQDRTRQIVRKQAANAI